MWFSDAKLYHLSSVSKFSLDDAQQLGILFFATPITPALKSGLLSPAPLALSHSHLRTQSLFSSRIYTGSLSALKSHDKLLGTSFKQFGIVHLTPLAPTKPNLLLSLHPPLSVPNQTLHVLHLNMTIKTLVQVPFY